MKFCLRSTYFMVAPLLHFASQRSLADDTAPVAADAVPILEIMKSGDLKLDGVTVDYLDKAGAPLKKGEGESRKEKMSGKYDWSKIPVGAVKAIIKDGGAERGEVELVAPGGGKKATVIKLDGTKLSSETEPIVESGKRGWVFVGQLKGADWKSLYLTSGEAGADKQRIKVGSTLTVDFPLKLREKPGGSEPASPPVRAGQEVKIEKLLQSPLPGGNSAVWAQIEVQQVHQVPVPKPVAPEVNPPNSTTPAPPR